MRIGGNMKQNTKFNTKEKIIGITMIILSVDVGIKNLAICIVKCDSSGNEIIEWVVINSIEKLLDNQLKCCVTKKGKLCNKVASNKVTLKDKTVLGFCNLKTCQAELTSNYAKKKIRKYKKIHANRVDLSLLGKNIFKGLSNLKNLDNLDYVVIENQPVLKNPRMKSVQMIIFSFFLFLTEKVNINHKVVLFNPSTKLKIYDGPEVKCDKKNKYAVRKYLSVEYTKYFLGKDEQNSGWIDFFNKSKKQDDLADSYLQALTYYSKLKL